MDQDKEPQPESIFETAIAKALFQYIFVTPPPIGNPMNPGQMIYHTAPGHQLFQSLTQNPEIVALVKKSANKLFEDNDDRLNEEVKDVIKATIAKYFFELMNKEGQSGFRTMQTITENIIYAEARKIAEELVVNSPDIRKAVENTVSTSKFSLDIKVSVTVVPDRE